MSVAGEAGQVLVARDDGRCVREDVAQLRGARAEEDRVVEIEDDSRVRTRKQRFEEADAGLRKKISVDEDDVEVLGVMQSHARRGQSNSRAGPAVQPA